ncbi:Nif3-like dinuclear metal center hexameric protein [Aminipila butyrica]|uniref:GTP cyclohydrolase 1 type 2 homolog n=1 Tax=Aminipila butyrica TaxID=433296 RepID=A0A858BWB7_9FIRM|nr:Nif3-like dinuclear metal center hexameric protein [Aminipila butyrica]QIB69479.1 Nif3-like dinuclear metal center hexameric protein [Aminipila butyrica]
MSISKWELIETLERIAPRELAEDWDNSGLQLNLPGNQVERILVTLEVTGAVIKEAVHKGADFIVAHHPLYFSSLKNIDSNNIIGNYTIDLIQNHISVFSAHTNFDRAPRGNNAYLASLLKLEDIEDFEDFGQGYMGLLGQLPQGRTLKGIAEELAGLLGIRQEDIRLVGDPQRQISKVGLCTGAGMDMLPAAALSGCQLLITGDVKYHDAVKAREMGMAVIDGGHYGTEKIFSENMAAQLKELLENKVEIFVTEVDGNPFDFI